MLRINGQATTEFIVILSLLTLIGIYIMTMMTDKGANAIGSGENAAVTAIQNDKD